MRDLLDDVGENRAIRSFLALYGTTTGISVDYMRTHMRLSGFKLWPAWVDTFDGHLTKGGAQDWLRYLFALEQGEQPADELTHEQITAGAAVLGDDGKPIGRNTAIMVADAMRGAGQPADGCHRSHPHENMSAECERKTEVARRENAMRCAEMGALEQAPSAATREALRSLIADDAYAMTFQSMAQYRSALLAALSQQAAQEPQPVAWRVGLELFATKPEAERNVRNPSLKPEPLYAAAPANSRKTVTQLVEETLAARCKSLPAAVADALRPYLAEGQKVIWREPFRWHDDGGVLSNHYEMMSATQLAEDFGYAVIEDCGCAAIIAALAHKGAQEGEKENG